MRKFIITLICISVWLTACFSDDRNQATQYSSVKKWNYKIIDDCKIKYPIDWKVVTQDSYYFFATPKNDYKYDFLTVGKYNIKASNLTVERYLKTIYNELSKKDVNEIFTGYTVKKMVFNDKISYYAEYFSTVNNQEYLAYSMVFEKDGIIFDILLKRKKDKENPHKPTFNDILFGFEIHNKPIFSISDKLLSSSDIDLSKI